MMEVCEDEACWLKLEEFRLVLIKNIDPALITPYLRQCQVLSSEDEEQIFNDQTLVIRRRKVGALLDILQRTGLKGYTAFLESLELDYPKLYQHITGKEPNRTFSILVDTVGESGLTQFLMSEVSRLQRALKEEKQRRQEAAALNRQQEETCRQQQLREREVRKLTEHLQKVRVEREGLAEEVRLLREQNFSLMTELTTLSQHNNTTLLSVRDLQLEIDRLNQRLQVAKSDSRVARRQTISLRTAMEQRPTADDLLSLQRQNMELNAKVTELERRSQSEGGEEQKRKEVHIPAPSQHMEFLSTIYSLKRDLHRAEEQRDMNQEEKEELELQCTRLKGDSWMYQQRNEETLRQLEDVIRERDKALSSRLDLHAEACSLLKEKDSYRHQLRQLSERSDKLQLQLIRSKARIVQLQSQLRKLACCQQGEQSHSHSSEDETATEDKEGSDDVASGFSGEKETAEHHPPQSPKKTREQGFTTAPWEKEGPDLRFRPRCRPDFFHRRKQAVRSKAASEHVTANLGDSSGSDITDSDEI